MTPSTRTLYLENDGCFSHKIMRDSSSNCSNLVIFDADS